METPPQDAILEAAATIFAEHGFAGARVEAIAKAAGINKAMLYYRVGDKARLYELVVLRQFERAARAVESAAGGAHPDQGARPSTAPDAARMRPNKATSGLDAVTAGSCTEQVGSGAVSVSEESAAVPATALLGRILTNMADLFCEDPRLPRIMAWELASGGANLPDSVMALWGRILGAVAPVAVKAGFDPAPAYFSMAGSMILFCLTEPLRKRAAASLGPDLPPALAGLGRAGVHDMAAFMTALFGRAAENPL